MIKKKNYKNYIPQLSLKAVIAVTITINILIFTYLFFPSSPCSDTNKWIKPTIQKEHSFIRLMYPGLNLFKVVKKFYHNKP